MGRALRSSRLFRVKVSQARFFQSSLKTGGGATLSGVRGIITEIMWS
jgi:hypothetical protein